MEVRWIGANTGVGMVFLMLFPVWRTQRERSGVIDALRSCFAPGGAVYSVNCSISKYDFHICMNHISHLCDHIFTYTFSHFHIHIYVILHDSN